MATAEFEAPHVANRVFPKSENIKEVTRLRKFTERYMTDGEFAAPSWRSL